MDEDWRNTFGILMWFLGAGPGVCGPDGSKSILYNHSHVANKSKVMKSRIQWPRRVQNSFCTNIVKLHIESKFMKSRIQWCKTFAPAYGWGLGKHIRNFDVTPEDRAMDVAPKGPKLILYKHSHVAYQIESYKDLNTVVQIFCLWVMSGVTRGQKVGFWVLFLLLPNSS